MNKNKTTRLIEILAYQHYLRCLVGNPAPITEAVLARIKNPKTGDLVVETSTIYDERKRGRLGYLREHGHEPLYTEEEIQDQMSGDFGRAFYGTPKEEQALRDLTREYWLIEDLKGKPVKWWNCRFIVVPEDLDFADQCFERWESES